MRKITLGLALCSTALAAPAVAKDDAAYIEFGFGPMAVDDFELTEFHLKLLCVRDGGIEH